jgi:heat shock 70kDa protein 1/2/6/8
VSILSMEGGVFTVKATGGDTHLGGEDFDNILVEWCLKNIEERHGKATLKAIKSSSRSMQRLRRGCETAKRTLSNAQETDIEIDALIDGSDSFNITLTRTHFEHLCESLLVRCMDTVKVVLRDARITIVEVCAIKGR